MVYLDWNATTPLAPDVVDAMKVAMDSGWANPASVHGPGRAARRFVEDARLAVAALTGYDARDVLLTSGGTEANNLVLRSFFADGVGALVTTRLEHPSIVETALRLEASGVEVAFVAPSASGSIETEALSEVLERLSSPPRLVSIQAVNHETGALHPIEALAAIAGAKGAMFHSDIVQAAGRVPLALRGVDVVTVASHKLRGPKGVGAVASRACVKLSGMFGGGAQERGVRPGTQDPIALAGFAAAAKRASSGPARYAAIAALRDRLERALIEGPVGAVSNAPTVRAPHVANLSFEGWLGPELCAALDLEGVFVSSGSACSAGTADPSPVISALFGVGRARSAVRISLGEESTAADIDRAIAAFERVSARARSTLNSAENAVRSVSENSLEARAPLSPDR